MSASTVVFPVPCVTTSAGPDPEISSAGISTPAREAVSRCRSAVVEISGSGIGNPARGAVVTMGLAADETSLGNLFPGAVKR